MATMAANLVQGDQYMISAMNLNGFFKWAGQASEDELDKVMAAVTMVQHRGPEWLTVESEPPLKVERKDLGRTWYMCEKICDVPNCGRCHSQCIGWHFTWIGPWTCSTVIGDESMTPAETYQRACECGCPLH